MPAKRPTSLEREQLVDNIHAAVRAYIEAGSGKAIAIGPLDIVPRIGMEFDLVIRCIGTRPKWDDHKELLILRESPPRRLPSGRDMSKEKVLSARIPRIAINRHVDTLTHRCKSLAHRWGEQFACVFTRDLGTFVAR